VHGWGRDAPAAVQSRRYARVAGGAGVGPPSRPPGAALAGSRSSAPGGHAADRPSGRTVGQRLLLGAALAGAPQTVAGVGTGFRGRRDRRLWSRIASARPRGRWWPGPRSTIAAPVGARRLGLGALTCPWPGGAVRKRVLAVRRQHLAPPLRRCVVPASTRAVSPAFTRMQHSCQRPAHFGRASDDHDALALLLVTALGAPFPLRVAGPRTSKPCSRCGRDLPLEAFNRESRAPDGRRADCRECQHERARQTYSRKRDRAASDEGIVRS
jgi:hypothetical protein